MVEYVAPKSEVRKVTNSIEQIMKRIDKLWKKKGFTNREMVFWAGNRDILHTMLDDTVRRYRITRYVK